MVGLAITLLIAMIYTYFLKAMIATATAIATVVYIMFLLASRAVAASLSSDKFCNHLKPSRALRKRWGFIKYIFICYQSPLLM
ncbi:hypothetical protein O9992_19350 [Vibrio lentus]|nr:hypothetical protein [Vibrio lentus]